MSDSEQTDPAVQPEGIVPSFGERRRDPADWAAKHPVVLEGVSKVYPGTSVPAVSGVDLRIEPGEFFSILGPSGSGKTTTLRMLAGFERPSSGRVLLGDQDLTNVPPYKRPVHTVFQSYALFPHMDVRANIGYPLKMAKVPKREIKSRVDEFIERVAVGQLADRMPHQLSGGQRQRVALARALVSHPQLVLLDEPLGALDLKLRQEMQIVLQHLQREVGITFVYVTHDQGEALAMSDRIAIMADGMLHQVGTPPEVYSRPETAFVASFVGRTNLLECTRTADGTVVCGDTPLKVADPPDADDFFVSVRPEILRLGPAAEGCDNQLDGFVDEAIYQGAEVELRIRTDLRVLVGRCTVGLHNVGDRIRVGWNVGDAPCVRTDPKPGDEAEAS